MDITNPVRGQFDRLLEATRDRPGTALALAIGGGLALGFISSRLIFRAAKVDWGAESGQEHGQACRRTNDSVAFSGESTPASSVAGNTPRFSLTGELNEKLDYSLVLVYRTDLNLSKGRLISLCSHATLGQFKKLWKAKSEDLKLWEKGPKAKLILQVRDENHLLQIEGLAQREGLPTFKVKEQTMGGRVPFVLAIGPARSSRIRDITSDLKMVQ